MGWSNCSLAQEHKKWTAILAIVSVCVLIIQNLLFLFLWVSLLSVSAQEPVPNPWMCNGFSYIAIQNFFSVLALGVNFPCPNQRNGKEPVLYSMIKHRVFGGNWQQFTDLFFLHEIHVYFYLILVLDCHYLLQTLYLFFFFIICVVFLSFSNQISWKFPFCLIL